MVSTMPIYAEKEARRLRALHKEMPLAFPLPISVFSVKVMPPYRCDGYDAIQTKRVPGPWETPCSCAACGGDGQQAPEEGK